MIVEVETETERSREQTLLILLTFGSSFNYVSLFGFLSDGFCGAFPTSWVGTSSSSARASFPSHSFFARSLKTGGQTEAACTVCTSAVREAASGVPLRHLGAHMPKGNGMEQTR